MMSAKSTWLPPTRLKLFGEKITQWEGLPRLIRHESHPLW